MKENNVWRYVVLADTHSDELKRAAELAQAAVRRWNPEGIVHLGDITERWFLEFLRQLAPTIAVQGDNDPPELGLPMKDFIEHAGRRIGLTHGNRPARKEDPSRDFNRLFGRFGIYRWNGFSSDIWKMFSEDNVEAILCGHLHHPMVLREKGIMIINPGAVFMNGLAHQKNALPSYGVLEISQHDIRVQIIPILKPLSRSAPWRTMPFAPFSQRCLPSGWIQV